MSTTHTSAAVDAVSTQAGRAIVVGFDGSPCGQDALDWAVDRAVAEQRPVRLVTAIDDRYPTIAYDAYHPDIRDEWRSLGRDELKSLGAVRDMITERHPQLEVELNVRLGAIVTILMDEAASQQLLVLGKRGLGAFGRITLGSVSIAVAGRAAVPVVVVPPGWKAAMHASEPVVVGLHPFRPVGATLEFAFAETARRETRVVIVDAQDTSPVLAWDIGAAEPSYLIAPRRPGLDAELEAVRKQYPEIAVTVIQEVGHPADILLRHTEVAQLLVVGRHRSGHLGFGIGSVARKVLHYSDVPVSVVPSE